MGSLDGKTQGIMPANYLKILGKKIGENTNPRPDQPIRENISNEEQRNQLN